MQCPGCGHGINPAQELCFRCGYRLAAGDSSSRWFVPFGRLFSLPVFVHKLVFLVPLAVVLILLSLQDPNSQLNFEWILESLLWMGIVASVSLVHELGHVFSMRMQGLHCRQILFYPIPLFSIAGWDLQASPKQRAAVALAGPVTSLAMALFLFPVTSFWPGEVWPVALCALHALAGAINLLPLEPFDGACMGAMLARPHESQPLRAPLAPVVVAEPELPETIESVDELEFDLQAFEDESTAVLDVDQILEKILVSGMDSLTERERSTLQEASRHLRR